MKSIFTFILSLVFTIALAQDPLFVHTATVANTSFAVTYIDHPDLNGNPDAKIIMNHNWNPPGSSGVFNDNVTSLYYDPAESKWTIYTEDLSDIIIGSSYNVYVVQGNSGIVHTADASNQGSDPSYSVIDHPSLNGNPSGHAVMTNYWNPFGIYNDYNYGFWYDGANWNLYTEDGSPVPVNASFFVVADGPYVQSMRHQANAGNIVNRWTIIDHPLLNGNPNAVFVFDHNWGVSGDPSNVVVNYTLGAWYDGSNWAIFMEDGVTPFPENAEFDLMIFDPSLGLGDNSLTKVQVYPNPASSQVTIETINEINQIDVYNVLGQQVLSVKGTSNQMNIDISALPSGTYMAKVISDNASKTVKLIKV